MQSKPHRKLNLLALFLFGAVLASGVARADVPRFVAEPLHSPNAAPIAGVIETPAADVVIINGGLEQGLRLGMVCRVVRGFSEVGELIVIESRSNRSAALILELAEDSFIQAGDIARIKTF